MNAKYRVYTIESERGWGQKPFGHKDFDTKDEAIQYMNLVNSENNLPVTPDWYVYANLPVLVDLDD